MNSIKITFKRVPDRHFVSVDITGDNVVGDSDSLFFFAKDDEDLFGKLILIKAAVKAVTGIEADKCSTPIETTNGRWMQLELTN